MNLINTYAINLYRNISGDNASYWLLGIEKGQKYAGFCHCRLGLTGNLVLEHGSFLLQVIFFSPLLSAILITTSGATLCKRSV